VRKRDREVIEIGECTPLDAVIERLQSLNCSLSEEAQPIVKVDGNEYFGWRLIVTYIREFTNEEYELEARYCGTNEPCSPL
jgi:hypothetical protein